MVSPTLGIRHLERNLKASLLEPFLDKLASRAELDAEDRAAITALPFAIKALDRSQRIVRERDTATHCCVILSGFSIRTKIVAGGERQIVALHMKGEVVDLQNALLRVADHGVEMLTSGQVALIPRDAILELTNRRPRVAKAMWVDTLVDASISREWIANVGRRDARTRITHLLCEFAVRLQVAGLGEETRYELPMTQEQLADATGLTPVHVNRTIRSLEKDGLIQRPDARSVQIVHWRKLAEVGDFDSNYLHLGSDHRL